MLSIDNHHGLKFNINGFAVLQNAICFEFDIVESDVTKNIMFNLFFKYASVGVLNTLIHWLSFFVLNEFLSQANSNFIAFLVAVSFSFVVNSKFTFQSDASLYRYLIYITFLGLLAYSIGKLADVITVNPIITLTTFSLVSLVLGFLYSKFFVFKA